MSEATLIDINGFKTVSKLRHGSHILNKKLCYRRRTARCDVSVKILPTAAQQCRQLVRQVQNELK